MPKKNDADAIPQGTVVRLSDGLAVVGDGPDSDDQYRIVRLFSDYSGPGFEDEENLTDVIGYIAADGFFHATDAAGLRHRPPSNIENSGFAASDNPADCPIASARHRP